MRQWKNANHLTGPGQVLIMQGADVNEKDEYGRTPLHAAMGNADLLVESPRAEPLTRRKEPTSDTATQCGSTQRG